MTPIQVEYKRMHWSAKGTVFCLWLPAFAAAAILPERFGDFQRTSVQAFTPTEQAVYEEYGLDAAEKAQYTAGSRKVEITALRAKDSTGAYGMYHWLRPAEGKPAELGERGAESGEMTIFQLGNYVVLIRGPRPETDHLNLLGAVLPRIERTAPPPLAQYLPAQGVVSNSERYVLGPVVLEKLAPAIPPSVAAFHLGAEAQFAEYQATGGRLALALFSYPTPQLARAQFEEFQKLPDLMVKRSGPLIAVVVKPFSRDEAARLLARVRWDATLTWSQQPGSQKDNVGNLILNIFLLTGIILGFALVAGLGFGSVRILLRRYLPGTRFDPGTDTDFVRLGLSDR